MAHAVERRRAESTNEQIEDKSDGGEPEGVSSERVRQVMRNTVFKAIEVDEWRTDRLDGGCREVRNVIKRVDNGARLCGRSRNFPACLKDHLS